MANPQTPKSVLIVPNKAGDGVTSFTRDLSTALTALKQPTPNVVALDYSDGELWRQSRLQDGFKAYPGKAFYEAWVALSRGSRHTEPELFKGDATMSERYKESITKDIKGSIDYLLMDARSYSLAPEVDMVILVARCDPRNLTTLRTNYQKLLAQNPNTYIVLVQGGTEEQVGYVTKAMSGRLEEKGLQSLKDNGAPLIIPQYNQTYALASREGLPSFRLPTDDRTTSDLRYKYHEAAVEVRRILKRLEIGKRNLEKV